MTKFIEIDANLVSGKMGWETEACFELVRAAENQEGQLMMFENNGMFDESATGSYEVSISLNASGDFRNHTDLTKEEADQVFESYL